MSLMTGRRSAPLTWSRYHSEAVFRLRDEDDEPKTC